MQINQLIYQSLATTAITPHQLQSLLPKWRISNHAMGISGLLLYGEEEIIQVLEGPAESVRQCYEVIARDKRHYNVYTLADGLVPTRAFGQWSMGFTQLDAPDFSRIAGYVSPSLPAGLLPNKPQAWPELVALLQEFVLRDQHFV
jgi:hypothetical protein